MPCGTTDIAIIGAGPAGIAMAVELLRRGHGVPIVSPLTLEQLREQMREPELGDFTVNPLESPYGGSYVEHSTAAL